jgi:hypothetical protein
MGDQWWRVAARGLTWSGTSTLLMVGLARSSVSVKSNSGGSARPLGHAAPRQAIDTTTDKRLGRCVHVSKNKMQPDCIRTFPATLSNQPQELLPSPA